MKTRSKKWPPFSPNKARSKGVMVQKLAIILGAAVSTFGVAQANFVTEDFTSQRTLETAVRQKLKAGIDCYKIKAQAIDQDKQANFKRLNQIALQTKIACADQLNQIATDLQSPVKGSIKSRQTLSNVFFQTQQTLPKIKSVGNAMLESSLQRNKAQKNQTFAQEQREAVINAQHQNAQTLIPIVEGVGRAEGGMTVLIKNPATINALNWLWQRLKSSLNV